MIFYRKFIDGNVKYVLVGTVTGNVNYCQGGLPDLYNFIGNEKVFPIPLSKHKMKYFRLRLNNEVS